MSLGSKYDEMKDFYTLLNAFINTHKAINTETKDRKDKILSYVVSVYNNYLNYYKKKYDNKDLTDKDKKSMTINSLK